MNRFGWIVLCPIVAGCATSTETFTPDGSKGHSINCPRRAQLGNVL